MRPVLRLLPCVAALLACQPMRKSAPPPDVNQALKVDTAGLLEMQQRTQACRALRDRPLAWRDEETMGARQAMELLDDTARREQAPDGSKTLSPPWLGLTEDEHASITENVNLLGKGLAAFSGRPGLPWTFVVVDLKRPAFFSSAGGFVFVTTGLLAQVENEAQLALVLALGIARVDLRRPVAELRDARYLACMSVLMNEALHDAMVGLTSSLPWVDGLPKDAGLEYAKQVHAVARRALGAPWDDEVVADAVWITAFAGYQPLEGARLLEKLALDDGKPPVAERVTRAAAELQHDFHLVTPRSKAADLVFRKSSALQPKTMP